MTLEHVSRFVGTDPYFLFIQSSMTELVKAWAHKFDTDFRSQHAPAHSMYVKELPLYKQIHDKKKQKN